jgi:hypothetical protein
MPCLGLCAAGAPLAADVRRTSPTKMTAEMVDATWRIGKVCMTFMTPVFELRNSLETPRCERLRSGAAAPFRRFSNSSDADASLISKRLKRRRSG